MAAKPISDINNGDDLQIVPIEPNTDHDVNDDEVVNRMIELGEMPGNVAVNWIANPTATKPN